MTTTANITTATGSTTRPLVTDAITHNGVEYALPNTHSLYVAANGLTRFPVRFEREANCTRVISCKNGECVGNFDLRHVGGKDYDLVFRNANREETHRIEYRGFKPTRDLFLYDAAAYLLPIFAGK